MFTQYLGFEVNEGEYKVMGLAPYGRPTYLDKLLDPILGSHDDGAFRSTSGSSISARPSGITRRRWPGISALRRARPAVEMREEHQDLAASVQQALEMAIGRTC